MLKIISAPIGFALNFLGYRLIKNRKKPSDLDLYYRLYNEESVNSRSFYNIGAGGFRHPAWKNVDYPSDWYSKATTGGIDVPHDLEGPDPIPVDTGTADIIYTSHTIEHISNNAANKLFREAFRMLKPGGVFRATTVNIDLEVSAYLNNDRDYFYWIDEYSIEKNWRRAMYNKPMNEASLEQVFLVHFASSASTLHADGAKERISDDDIKRVFCKMSTPDALDYCISKCDPDVQKKYPGNHINWWNKDKLVSSLESAGFTKIYPSAHGQSQCPPLRNLDFFDNTRPKNSIYIECIK